MTTADPWMCRNCAKAPVPALGETFCTDCAASAPAPPEQRSAQAVETARRYLETSDKATAFKNKAPDLAIAAALQGILVCQIELVELSSQAGEMPGGFILPAEALMEPEPEIGPKPWGNPVLGQDGL